MHPEQNINPSRYQVIPRTLIFVTRKDSLLLLPVAPKGGKITRWTGRLNGLGGHVERGEDILTSARRELQEEAGIQADLWLCGALMVDTGASPGIGLYLFTGEYTSGELHSSAEGAPAWHPWQEVENLPLLEDLPPLLQRIRLLRRGDPPFLAISSPDPQGKMQVRFGESK